MAQPWSNAVFARITNEAIRLPSLSSVVCFKPLSIPTSPSTTKYLTPFGRVARVGDIYPKELARDMREFFNSLLGALKTL